MPEPDTVAIENQIEDLKTKVESIDSEIKSVKNELSEIQEQSETLDERTRNLAEIYDQVMNDKNPFTETTETHAETDTNQENDINTQKHSEESFEYLSEDDIQTRSITTVDEKITTLSEDQTESVKDLLLYLIGNGGKDGAKNAIKEFYENKYISETVRNQLLNKVESNTSISNSHKELSLEQIKHSIELLQKINERD